VQNLPLQLLILFCFKNKSIFDSSKNVLSNLLPYIDKNEKELLPLIADGDEIAFKQLYKRLLPYLAGAGFKLLRSEEAVAEVIQESLMRLWVHREKLRNVEYPRAWVFKLFSNECLRYLKKNGLQYVPLDALSEADLYGAAAVPEHPFAMRETQDIIYYAVTGLSPRQREIYRLSRERGLKIPEIAAELGLTSKYVKKTLILALQAIRRKLVEAGKYSVALIFLLFFQ
jgi:RNA polymerase sigma-70 factor (ECF subfamily)